MWRTAIDRVIGDEGRLGFDLDETADEPRGLGTLVAAFGIASAAVVLALLPAVVGMGVLMGRTLALGIAVGVGVSALVGLKALAMGWGILGLISNRSVAAAAAAEAD